MADYQIGFVLPQGAEIKTGERFKATASMILNPILPLLPVSIRCG